MKYYATDKATGTMREVTKAQAMDILEGFWKPSYLKAVFKKQDEEFLLWTPFYYIESRIEE